MANAQLVTYVKQQLQLGEAEGTVKNSLSSVGWSDVDITEAFKAASPMAAPSLSQNPIQPTAPNSPSPSAYQSPSTPVSSPSPTQSPATTGFSHSAFQKPASAIEPKKIDLGSFAPANAPSTSRTSPATISFSSKSNTPASIASFASSHPAEEGKKSSIITNVLMGLIVVALATLSGFLFKNNTDLKAKVADFTNQVNALTGQITGSGQGATELAQRITQLEESVRDLDSQLALFLPIRMVTSTSESAATGTPVIVSSPAQLILKGALSGGGNVNYTLTTSKDIKVNIRNSRDAKVVAALGPLVGNPIEVTGIQTSGAREITVTHVNGALIQ